MIYSINNIIFLLLGFPGEFGLTLPRVLVVSFSSCYIPIHPLLASFPLLFPLPRPNLLEPTKVLFPPLFSVSFGLSLCDRPTRHSGLASFRPSPSLTLPHLPPSARTPPRHGVPKYIFESRTYDLRLIRDSRYWLLLSTPTILREVGSGSSLIGIISIIREAPVSSPLLLPPLPYRTVVPGNIHSIPSRMIPTTPTTPLEGVQCTCTPYSVRSTPSCF